MDACGYVSAVATPEILEAKIDTTLSYFADLSYFFGPAADSIQIDKVQYPDRTVVERCAMIRDSGDKTELVLEMWSRVKGDNLGVGVVIVLPVSYTHLDVYKRQISMFAQSFIDIIIPVKIVMESAHYWEG